MTSGNELVRFLGFTLVFAWLFWLPGVLTFLGVMNFPGGLGLVPTQPRNYH